MDLTSVKELHTLTKHRKKKPRPSFIQQTADSRSGIYRDASFLYSDFDHPSALPDSDDAASEVSSVDSADHYLYQSMKISQMHPSMRRTELPETTGIYFSEGEGQDNIRRDSSDDDSSPQSQALALPVTEPRSNSDGDFTLSVREYKFPPGAAIEPSIKDLIDYLSGEVVSKRRDIVPIPAEQEEKKERASQLTESVNKILAAGGVVKRRFFIQPPEPASPLRLTLRVYLLGTPLHISITVSKANSIGELIKHILTCVDLEPSFDKDMIKYPDIPEAYELRLLEDDCDYEPDFEISPLDVHKKIGNFGQIDAIALTDVQGFNPKRYARTDELHKENLLILKKLTSNNKAEIGIRIYMRFNQAGLSSKVLRAKREDTLADVLKKLEQKLDEGLLRPEQFYFTSYQPVPQEIDQPYDMDTPVDILQTNEIELRRRIRKDEPMSSLTLQEQSFINTFDPRLTDFSKMQTYLEQALQQVGTLLENEEPQAPLERVVSKELYDDQGKDEEDFLFNSNTAGQYRQFKVVKINIRGKRQERVIGLDAHYIYNKKVYRKATMISSIIPDKFGSHFEKTHHTNWGIDEIDQMERSEARRVRIRFKDEKKYNRLLLEFKSKTEASEFTAKLRFLLRQLASEGVSRVPSVMI